MAAHRNKTEQEEQDPPWLGLAKFLFIVFFAVMVFLLISSMEHHHFFSGGQMNKHDATEP
jgi:hypothetical protein